MADTDNELTTGSTPEAETETTSGADFSSTSSVWGQNYHNTDISYPGHGEYVNDFVNTGIDSDVNPISALESHNGYRSEKLNGVVDELTDNVIYDSTEHESTTISFNADSFTMVKGAFLKLDSSIVPNPIYANIPKCTFVVEDETPTVEDNTVMEVRNSVLYAVNAGTAKIVAYTKTIAGDVLKATATVTVEDKSNEAE